MAEKQKQEGPLWKAFEAFFKGKEAHWACDKHTKEDSPPHPLGYTHPTQYLVPVAQPIGTCMACGVAKTDLQGFIALQRHGDFRGLICDVYFDDCKVTKQYASFCIHHATLSGSFCQTCRDRLRLLQRSSQPIPDSSVIRKCWFCISDM